MKFVKKFKALPNGRKITVGAVYNEDTYEIKFGISVCKPGEPFSKECAHNKAIGRAESSHSFYHEQIVPSPDRTAIEKFFYTVAEKLAEQKNEEIELRLQILANMRG